ncbi:diaminopropionate ammonia-lyase [Thalassospira sp. MCCC 1A01428]|uniref:diaminopropionate ammonia-lyase n=1 Tax=Thalassospira sp. MCCC 1A01428 TaxID=1470575 RepID=UPI000A1F28EE|nr:diaminopropionate ammonia-lyase [Thalassospira sp. MCCC 1A01428]
MSKQPDSGIDALFPGRDEIYRALDLISDWQEYRPSPLLSAPGLAKQLGIGSVLIKDESRRFGLGGVKALGAPYGLKQQLLDLGLVPGSTDCAGFTAVAATDGNHGLALAWAAAKFGCNARIYVGTDVNVGRVQRMRDNGADIVVVAGTYDDAVLAAENAARDAGVLLITDTDYHGGIKVTRDIMAGYAVMGIECARQLEQIGVWPGHVFLQCGVGGMAAGCVLGLWHESGRKPGVITVEATNAACVKQSLAQGRPVSVAGQLLTRMVGLSCGRPSLPAFDILQKVARGSIAIDDAIALHAQTELGRGINGDVPLDCWDTGIAGIAGLWHVAQSPVLRAQFNLDANSSVLVVNSEGAMPARYASTITPVPAYAITGQP